MGHDKIQQELSIKFPKGSCGLWESPTIGTKSWLYRSPANTLAQNQKVVDRENCALWWPYGKGHAVIDHADSEVPGGLWRVQDMCVDDNAVLNLPNGIKKYYTCMGMLRCRRERGGYTWNGKSFSPLTKDDVVCISCATTDGSEVYVAYFKYNYSIGLSTIIQNIKK
jgi:hypothetical protein